MLGTNSSTNNAVLAPFGGLGGTRTAPGSTFFFPASFFAPVAKPAPIPTMRAFTPGDLGFDGFNTRNQTKKDGLLSTILTGDNGGNLLTQRPTLLPGIY